MGVGREVHADCHTLHDSADELLLLKHHRRRAVERKLRCAGLVAADDGVRLVPFRQAATSPHSASSASATHLLSSCSAALVLHPTMSSKASSTSSAFGRWFRSCAVNLPIISANSFGRSSRDALTSSATSVRLRTAIASCAVGEGNSLLPIAASVIGHAKRIEITRSIGVAVKHFGSDVRELPHEGRCTRKRQVVAQDPRNPEIAQLALARLAEKNVAGRHITMNDLVSMGVLERRRHIARDMKDHERRQQRLVPPANLDQPRKGDAVHQLHREVRATSENSRVHYPNDVGVLEPGPNPRFLRKALQEFLFLVFGAPEKLGKHVLQCNPKPVTVLATTHRFKRLSHAALAKLSADLVLRTLGHSISAFRRVIFLLSPGATFTYFGSSGYSSPICTL